MSEHNQRTGSPTSWREFFLRLFQTAYGTPLTRLFKLCVFMAIACTAGSFTPETVQQLGDGVAGLFDNERLANITRSAVVFFVEFLEKHSLTTGYILFGFAGLILLWIFYERYRQLQKGDDTPLVSIMNGQLFYYGSPLGQASWLTRLHFHLSVSLGDLIPILDVPADRDQLYQLHWFQPLRSKLPVSRADRNKKASTEKRVVPHRYLLKKVILNPQGERIFYLLGDSGMGKTITLLQTYLDLIRSPQSWGLQIMAIRFSEWEDRQAEWKEAGYEPKNLIVLLDGADEDARIYDEAHDFKEKIKAIKDAGYHRVVISCRSQFAEQRRSVILRPKLIVKGFTDRDYQRYLRRRFRWYRWHSRRKRKAVNRWLNKDLNLHHRPLLVDWLCTFADPLGKQQLQPDQLQYTYQFLEAIILHWYNREKDRLEKGGFTLTLDQIQRLMKAIAVHFYEQEEPRFTLTHKQLKDLVTDTLGDTVPDDALTSYLVQSKTRTLLSRDEQDYFFFAHQAIWEVIIARLLFEGLEHELRYDDLTRPYPAIQNLYNQMCWAEIVPEDALALSVAEKEKIKLYRERDVEKVLDDARHFQLKMVPADQRKDIQRLILSFNDPAERAFFLGMQAASLRQLPREEGRWKCFTVMLADWAAQSGLSPEPVCREYVRKLHGEWDLERLTNERYYQAIDEAAEFSGEHYLDASHCLFRRDAQDQIRFRHKCLLDYYLAGSQAFTDWEFLETYAHCTDFVVEGATGLSLDNHTLSITEKSQTPALAFHPAPASVTDLQVKGVGLPHLGLLFPFRNLTSLDLSDNSLHDATFFRRWPRLHTLILDNNKITSINELIGPTEMVADDLGRMVSGLHLPRLEKLSIKGNPLALSGEVGYALAVQPELRELYLPENCLPEHSRAGEQLTLLRNQTLAHPSMVLVEGGTFTMGKTDDYEIPDTYTADARQKVEAILSREQPPHRLSVDSFYLAKFAVTLDDFRRFVTATAYQTTAEQEGDSVVFNFSNGKYEKRSGVNWRHDHEGELAIYERRPVLHVSWYDAVAYCNWLSEQEGYTPVYTIDGNNVSTNWEANGYRLPTEAEWEYAAKGGRFKNTFRYAGSDAINQVAWWGGNAGNRAIEELTTSLGFSLNAFLNSRPYPHAVGLLLSNTLGLYDLSGNVFEWCEDDWHNNYKGAPQDGSAWVDSPRGSGRVYRGGGWDYDPRYCRAAYRDYWGPASRYYFFGFRVARSF